MNIERKTLGILAILFFVATVTLFVSCTITEENKQPFFNYTVQANDTCSKVAVALDVSVISIVETNHLKRDCSNIYVGQVLLIPYSTPTPVGSPVATFRDIVIDCFERVKYTVQEDDTLETISSKYKVSKETIVSFNGLSENKVEKGIQLIIPLCYTTPNP